MLVADSDVEWEHRLQALGADGWHVRSTVGGIVYNGRPAVRVILAKETT